MGAITSPRATMVVTHGHTQVRQAQLTTAKVAPVLRKHISGARASPGVPHLDGKASLFSVELH